MLWIILAAITYCLIGALTGGYIYQVRNRGHRNFGGDDATFVGAGWPLTLIWYLILKPLSRTGHYLAEKQETRAQRLKHIREQLEAVERERQLEIQKHIRELEAEEAEHQARQQQRASA